MPVFKYLFKQRVHSQKWGLIEKGCLIELNEDTQEGRSWLHISQVADLYVGPRRGDNLPEYMKNSAAPTDAENDKAKAANIFNKLAGGTLPPRPASLVEHQQLRDALDIAPEYVAPIVEEPKKSNNPFKKK